MVFNRKKFTLIEDVKIYFCMNSTGAHRLRVYDSETGKVRATGMIAAYGNPSFVEYKGRFFIAFTAAYDGGVPFIEIPMELKLYMKDEGTMNDQAQSLKYQYEKACLTRIFSECPNVPFHEIERFIIDHGLNDSNLTLGQLLSNTETKAAKRPKIAKNTKKNKTRRKSRPWTITLASPPSSNESETDPWERWAENERNSNFQLQEVGKLNFRLKQDRDIYDDIVLSFLKKWKKWESSLNIRKVCGGSVDQARGALNRLIESGNIEYKGRGADLKYKASTKRAPFKKKSREIVINDSSKDQQFTTMMFGGAETAASVPAPVIDKPDE